MHGATEIVERAMLFGMDRTITALTIILVSFAIIFTEKINRTIVVMFAGALMIITGVLSQTKAIEGIDFNTLGLLVGMMIIVTIMEKTGIFQFVAIWAAKKVKANPRGLLAVMSLVCGLLSGIVDSVTAVFLMTPIIFQITRRLGVRAFPYLMMIIFSANIGGAATLVGNPPNILVGSAGNFSFMDFVYNMMPISYITLAILIISFDLIWGRKIVATKEARKLVMAMDERDLLTDKNLLVKSISVMTGVVVGLIAAHSLHIETGTIALFGASILLFLYTRGLRHNDVSTKVEEVLSLVDWSTIFFFMGLFVLVYGLETTGLLEAIGHMFVNITDGVVSKLIFVFLWSASLVSCLIDNIPFAATMIPIIKSIEVDMGGREAILPAWWALMVGASFGGNGTLIASSANVVVAGLAMKEGQHISFFKFMVWGIPVTIISVTIAMIFIYFKYPEHTQMF